MLIYKYLLNYVNLHDLINIVYPSGDPSGIISIISTHFSLIVLQQKNIHSVNLCISISNNI